MAYLTKLQVQQIVQNAPPGLDPGKIVQSLVAQGNTLQGLNDSAQTPSGQSAPTTNQPQQQGSALGNAIGQTAHQVGQNTIGLAKTVPSTLNNLSTLGQRALGFITNPIINALSGKNAPQASLPSSITTPTPEQAPSFLGGQIGETLLGGPAFSAIGKGAGEVAGAANLGRVGQFAAKSLAEGAAGAGIAKLQGASDQGALGAGAVGAALPAVGAAIKGLSPALSSFLSFTGGAGKPDLWNRFYLNHLILP